MMNADCTPVLYIPPSNFYTSLEKTLLAFDNDFWYGIWATIILYCVIILICTNIPKNIKRITRISTSDTTAFHTFRFKILNGNFIRLTMISFTFCYFVIKIAFQGKLYEFTTTAIRKPEIKSLEELRNNNFTFFISEIVEQYETYGRLHIKKVINLSTKVVSNTEFINIYYENLTDPSFTGTILTCDLEHKMSNFYRQIAMPERFVPTSFGKSYYGIGFQYPNLWAERFNEIVEGLVTGGIMNFYIERMTKSKWNQMEANDHSEKTMLDMTNLSFCFQICFFLLYLSFVLFIFELIVNWTGKFLERFRTVKDSKIGISIVNKDFINSYATLTSIITKGNFISESNMMALIESQSSQSFNALFGRKVELTEADVTEYVDGIVVDFLQYIIEDHEN
ncbi:hypothetical protein ACKWTF_010395 [Chironomus riparius]